MSVSRNALDRARSIAVAAVWLVAVVAGLGALSRYAATPGSQDEAPLQWPASSRVTRSLDRATLVMFAHPHCPCTEASLGELNGLMARTQGRLAVRVVVFHPVAPVSEWPAGGVGKSAAEIPGVMVLDDDDGIEARRFGALTSGQTLLYDSGGRLVFSGGITSARGHSGDNAGVTAIASLVNHGWAERTRTPVFGCAILGAAKPR